MLPISSKGSCHLAHIKSTFKASTALPDALVDLTISYLQTKDAFIIAIAPLFFDDDGKLTNPPVREKIKEALISNICDGQIKRQIFINLINATCPCYIAEFNQMLKEIDQLDYCVNLDFTNLKQLDLSDLIFYRISLRHACLIETNIMRCVMSFVDLTAAKLNKARIHMVRIDSSVMTEVIWDGAEISRLTLTDAVNVQFTRMNKISRVAVNGKTVDDYDASMIFDFTEYTQELPVQAGIKSRSGQPLNLPELL